MATRSGLQVITFPVKPVGQLTTLWTGNQTVLGYLNKGTYLVFFNSALRAPANGGITSVQIVVTQNSPYTIGDYQEILATGKSGPMGLPATNIFNFSFQNTIDIIANNTPIYLYYNLSILAQTTWSTPTNTVVYNAWCNKLVFVSV